MKILLIMSVFWIGYGILGILGVQNIPKKYKLTKYAKEYKKFAGTGWLLLGIPWFIIWIVTHNIDISPLIIVFILVACAIPSAVYTYIGDKKFRKRLEKDNLVFIGSTKEE